MILSGRPVAERIVGVVRGARARTRAPKTCAIVYNSHDHTHGVFVKAKSKIFQGYGIKIQLWDIHHRPYDYVKRLLLDLADSNQVDAVILQLPLPEALKQHLLEFLSLIPKEKDIDALSPLNFGALALGQSNYAPAVSESIVHILKHYNIEVSGRKILIIGDGILVGRPTYLLFRQLFKPDLVTVVDKNVSNLLGLVKQYEVIVSGTGVCGLLKTTDLISNNKHVILLDAGTNVDETGRICGDFTIADESMGANNLTNLDFTPTPGGIGLLTPYILVARMFNIDLLNTLWGII